MSSTPPSDGDGPATWVEPRPTLEPGGRRETLGERTTEGTPTLQDPGLWDDGPERTDDPGPALSPEERYERLGLIGKGGMGEVWRVRDRLLGRRMAMKLVRSDRSSRHLRARFVEEAQVTAQLQHPGIVPVHDLGRLADGRVFYTMREVRGRTLREVLSEVHEASTAAAWGLARSGWSFLRLMDAFRQVCATVAYAHARGVIHRDLKPDNILLGPFGQVLVLDWGLVKVLGAPSLPADEALPEPAVSSVRSRDAAVATRVGQVAGTVGYMSPEQARGEVDRLSPASDVYALGAILVKILVGCAPPGPGEPLTWPPRAPVALRELCEAALATDPGERPATAGPLAEAVASWLEGAREIEQGRARAEAAEAALTALAPSEQVLARSVLLRLVTPEGELARVPAAELEEAGLTGLIDGLVLLREGDRAGLADAALLAHWPRLRGWLEAEGPRHRTRHALAEAARSWEAAGRPDRLLWRSAERAGELTALSTPGTFLTRAERDFLGRSAAAAARRRRERGLLALAGVLALGAVAAVTTRLWLVAEDRGDALAEQTRAAESRLLVAEGNRRAGALELDAASALLRAALDHGAGAAEPELARTLDRQVASRGPSWVLGVGGAPVLQSRVSWSGDRLLTGTEDGWVRIWDVRTGALLHELEHGGVVKRVAWTPDDATVLGLGHPDGGLRAWSAETGELLWARPGDNEWSSALAVSPDGRLVVIGSRDGPVPVIDVRSGEAAFFLEGHEDYVFDVAFSPDGRRLVSASTDYSARIWDMETGAPLQVLAHPAQLLRARFALGGRRVVTTGVYALQGWLWDAGTGEQVATLEGAELRLTEARSSPDGALILAGSEDRQARLFVAETGALRHTLRGHAAPVDITAFHPSQPLAATGDASGRVVLWDTDTGRPLEELQAHQSRVFDLVFSADGRALLSASDQGRVRIWEPLAPRASTHRTCGHGSVLDWRASPDASALLIVSDDGRVCLADLTGAREPWTVPLPPYANGGDWSPDSSRVLLWTAHHPDELAEVWEVDGRRRTSSLEGGLRNTWPGGFSSDGERVHAVDRSKRALGTWVADSGRLLGTVPLPDKSMATFVGGDVVVVNLQDQRAQVWDMATRRLLFEDTSTGVNPFFRLPSERGSWVAVAEATGGVRIHHLGPGGEVLRLPGEGHSIRHLAVDRAESRVAVARSSGAVDVYDAATATRLRSFQARGGATRAGFSADGRRLALVDRGVGVEVWDLETGRALLGLEEPDTGGMALGAALVGGALLTLDDGGTVRTWPVPEEPPGDAAGARSNLRVCRGSFEVVPVMPFPPAEEIWAPTEACGAATDASSPRSG